MEQEKEKTKKNHSSTISRNIVRIVAVVLAIALIGVGLYFGDYRAVLSKAMRICYECIGIG